MASRKGYEPRAMVEALSALERGAAQQAREASREPKNGKSDPSPDDDFDPHPAPGARIARAAVAAGKGGGEWGRERYFARIGGLEWGEGSTTPVLLGSRYVVPGDLSFAVPRGYRAKSERGILEAKVSEEASLVAFRMQGSFISEALKASIAKGRNVTRDLAGRHAIVARAGTGEGKAAGTKTKKDDSLMAVVDGPPSALVVVMKGNSPAAERVLDAFLASAKPDTATRRPRSVLTIERADGRTRFDDFVRTRCPGTMLDLATALNGRAAGAELAPQAFVKCLKVQ